MGGGDNGEGSNFGSWADLVVPGGSGSIGAGLGTLAPDYNTGGMYSPINWTPPASAYNHVSPTLDNGDHAAEDLNAKVIGAQYKDYEQRFQPFENLAVSLLTPTGTTDLAGDVKRSDATIGGVYSSLEGQQGRAMERFGQTNTAKNITGSNAEAGAKVGGLNAAVLNDEARREALLGGGSTTASGAVASATGQGGGN